jgi:hypothetical protein
MTLGDLKRHLDGLSIVDDDAEVLVSVKGHERGFTLGHVSEDGSGPTGSVWLECKPLAPDPDDEGETTED